MPYLSREAHAQLQSELNHKAPPNKKPFTPDYARKIVERAGSEYIGSGERSVVIADADLPGTVIAIDYRAERYKTIEAATCIFHAHQILHTLFPDHFPQIYTVYGGNEGSGSIREKKDIIKLKVKPETVSVIHRALRNCFAPIATQIEKLGLPFHIDNNPLNFGFAANKKIQYLDLVHVYQQEMKEIDISQLEVKLARSGHSERKIEIVVRHLNRLKTICTDSDQY